MLIAWNLILSVAAARLATPPAGADTSPSKDVPSTPSNGCRSDCVGDVVSMQLSEDRAWFFPKVVDCTVDRATYEAFKPAFTERILKHLPQWSWLQCKSGEIQFSGTASGGGVYEKWSNHCLAKPTFVTFCDQKRCC
ncbi:hypothetical protein RJ55_02080 [Drechmeria coniospora]|nr:hypothetical protein RJ55_02080 [Drechmeria coniospora]